MSRSSEPPVTTDQAWHETGSWAERWDEGAAASERVPVPSATLAGGRAPRTDRMGTASDWERAAADGFARRLHWLARRLGVAAEAALWTARAAFAVSRATAAGHVCVRLDALAERYGVSAAAVCAALAQSALVADGAMQPGAAVPLVLDRDGRIYLARYFEYERQLARALVAQARAPQAAGAAVAQMRNEAEAAARLQRYFGTPSAHEIDWQRVAAAVALDGPVTIVSGGPGTGKTTTVVGVLACLLDADPQLRVALAAPTGKAAQRMLEALRARAAHLPSDLAARLPGKAFTLHRLLGSGAGGRFRHHREQPLPYDLVVVDEASMIDVALAAHLVDALAPGARLVLLGDKDQLAAVEAGAVFAELSARPVFSAAARARLASNLGIAPGVLAAALAEPAPDDAGPLADRVVWLERNYRFGLDSPIGRLSLAIKRGDAPAALAEFAQAAPGVLRFDEDPGDTLSAATLERLAAGFAGYAALLRGLSAAPAAPDVDALFAALARFRILCATRGGARGTDSINAAAAAYVRRLARLPLAPGAQWFAGRPVMVSRNDYALGLFNGDLGIALPDARGVLQVYFGPARAVPVAALPPHDTAFALTVHKSQGSEFDEAALVLPARFQRVLSRELIYTAITRAREQVAVIGSREVWTQALTVQTQRDSGLAARLEEAWRESLV